MVPALLAESGVVSQHHPLGASTGYMEDSRDDWPAMVAELCDPVIVLAQGRRLVAGPFARIRRDPRVLEAYLGAPA